MRLFALLVLAIGLWGAGGCQSQHPSTAPTQETESVTAPAEVSTPAVSTDASVMTALFEAAEKGDAGRAVSLLGQGADIDAARQDDGNTALHIAAQYGHSDMVQVLLDHGANISARNSLGATPLMSAASGGHRMSVEILLLAGADRIARNESGLTALDLARGNNHYEVVRLLEEYK